MSMQNAFVIAILNKTVRYQRKGNHNEKKLEFEIYINQNK